MDMFKQVFLLSLLLALSLQSENNLIDFITDNIRIDYMKEADLNLKQQEQLHNETISIVLTQQFFDNIQQNVTVPLINQLKGELFNDLEIFLNLGFMNFSLNLTNITIYNASISNDTSIITLKENQLIINLTDFTLNFTLIYEYISDPPIFVDIGSTFFLIDDYDLYLNLSPLLINNTFNIEINQLNMSMDVIDFEMDGISDMSIVLTNFLNSTLNIIYNRIRSIINYKLKDDFEPILNSILDIIPKNFTLPGTDIILTFFLNDNLDISEDPIQYMEIPLDFFIESSQNPYPYSNNNTLPTFINSSYQVELFLSEYFLNSILYVLSKEDYLQLYFYDPEIFNLTTDLLYIVVGKGILDYFDEDMPCSTTVSSIDPPPTIDIYPNISTIQANVTLDFMCQKHLNDSNFYQVVTLINEVNLTQNFSVDNNFTIYLYLQNLSIALIGYENSTIGDIDLEGIQLWMSIIENLLESILNNLFSNGVSVDWVIKDLLNIQFIDLYYFNLINNDGYIQIDMTPIFNITNLNITKNINLELEASKYFEIVQ